MDNVAEAIKMAGFMLIFTIALSVAMFTIIKSKNASEAVIKYSDSTRIRSNIDISNGEVQSNRIVTINDIIPTLYRYKQEDYIILFYNTDKSGPLKILEIDNRHGYNFNKIKQNNNNNNNNNNNISYLNYHIDDYYNEDWMGNDKKTKQHIDDVVEYLLKNSDIKTAKFEEQVSETENMYLNNNNVTKKNSRTEPLLKNINEGIDDDSKKQDPIRVIKYIKQ